ncbi:MAG: sigma-70 family RNA polymerase sigma factor [Muribaculaceae bacterium]|nr:sigma-70 family RNA polymerase sigma factor [Muribaculaceae bacterium]
MNADEFKQRFLPLNAKLYKVAYLLLGNEDDAKDAVQDAYMKMWNRRDSLADIDNSQAYCVTLVRNLCLDRHRAASIDIVDKPPEELPIAGNEDASQHIERQQAAHLLDQCLARLPAQQQQVVRLRDINGCSMQEIEKVTGLTPVNTRVLLSRARKSLRTQLQNVMSS